MSQELDPVNHDAEQGRRWMAGEIDDASYFAEAKEQARLEATADLELKIKSGRTPRYLDAANPEAGIKINTPSRSNVLRDLINRFIEDRER